MQNNNAITEEQALKLFEEWKARLGLQEWRISFYPLCKPDELDDESAGTTVWQEVNKTARINILDEKYYGDRVVGFDFEKTLVHELLHLKTCLISDTDNELQQRIMHQLIDDMARAFVDAKRSK